jgi:hypothetical protein
MLSDIFLAPKLVSTALNSYRTVGMLVNDKNKEMVIFPQISIVNISDIMAS